MHIGLWRECLKERARSEDTDVDGRKVLQLILKQLNDSVCVCFVCACVYLIQWLKVITTGGHL